MLKKTSVFLLLLILFFLSGCSTDMPTKVLFTQEELVDFTSLPEYKIWIGENYLKLENQNQSDHLVPVDLLRIVFSDEMPSLPQDGIARYVKALGFEEISGIDIKTTGNILEIGNINQEEQKEFNYVSLKWEDPVGYLFLVNQDYPLHNEYEDQNLVTIKSPHLQPLYNNMRLSEEAFIHLQEMSEDYYKDNNSSMILVSTYRDYNHQERIFKNRIATNKQNLGLSDEGAYNKAAEIIAIPGTSEHQSGLAIDFTNANLMNQGRTLVNDFSQEKEGKWLLEKGKDYGFILRYPKGKTEVTKIVFEPWHYRYVGYPHSQVIYENAWTLEEYLEYLEENSKYETEDYSIFYLDAEKIFAYEIYYSDDIKIENDNKGGWVLSRTTN